MSSLTPRISCFGSVAPCRTTARRLIEFVTGPAGAATTAFVVTRHRVAALVLEPADSLVDDIALLDGLIDQRQDARAVAFAIGSRVLAPVTRGLPAAVTRLVIVPDGPLYEIPFAALRVSGGAYAVERYAIRALAPSATVAADSRARGRCASAQGACARLW